ncbi:MAG: DUF1552 domain-containing protein [Planctomycetes bacterium]|nr:DUF1552 domain-containing protein [Planctomycetota bacterium]
MPPLRRLALDRRTFLRGTGAAIALPWLEAMQPALAPTRALPRRALFVFAPNGKKMDDWTPAQTGRSFALPFLLEPLAPVRDRVTVFSGLAIDGGRAHGDGPGDHARAAGSFLTCAHPKKTGGADLQAGVSVDQVLAAQTGGATTFASLELGMEKGNQAGICDSGYSCAYSNNIAWRNAGTPVAKEHDPRAVFARLFGDPDRARDAAAAERDRATRRSVLDAVLADSKALQGRLGSTDRQKLDQYLTAVRELEQRLQRVEAPAADQPAPPAGVLAARTFADKLAAMYELLALAFATDRTRIATFMLGNAGSNRGYDFLGVPEGHHDLSHHGKKPEKLAGIRKINRFHTEAFAVFLQRLTAHREGDGGLLDQTLVVYGSGIGDGDRHNHDDLPVLLCGGGGGVHRGGAHVRLGKDTPMANLYLAVLQAYGCRDERFGDSTGTLDLR